MSQRDWVFCFAGFAAGVVSTITVAMILIEIYLPKWEP